LTLIAAAIESANQSDYHPNHNLPVPLLDAGGTSTLFCGPPRTGRN
jgi:hypothetical protein